MSEIGGLQVVPHPGQADYSFQAEIEDKRERDRKRRMVIGLSVFTLVVLVFGFLMFTLFRSATAGIGVANATMSHISDGDAEAAYNSLAPGCRTVSVADFEPLIGFVDGGTYDLKNFNATKIVGQDETAIVSGTVSPPTGESRPVRISLVKHDDEWTTCGVFIS